MATDVRTMTAQAQTTDSIAAPPIDLFGKA
jgi:hypothetical protein